MSAADQAREKLAAVEREADEIAEQFPNGLPEFMAANLADRWQSSIAAAQALATLEVADRLAAVVGLLEVLAAPAQPMRLVDAGAYTESDAGNDFTPDDLALLSAMEGATVDAGGELTLPSGRKIVNRTTGRHTVWYLAGYRSRR